MSKIQQPNVQTFESEMFGKLRTSQSPDGKLWFCLADVCNALEISNTANAKKRLDSSGVYSIKVTRNSSNRHNVSFECKDEMLFIDEPNLYRCIFQSRKKQAKRFQDWVFEEVLPSIRSTGGYIPHSEEDDENAILARALQIAQKKIDCLTYFAQSEHKTCELLKEGFEYMYPKAQYAERVLHAPNTYTARHMAKELNLRSAQELHNELERRKLMFNDGRGWMPYACVSDKGYFATRTHPYYNRKGEKLNDTYFVFTEHGRQWLHELFGNFDSTPFLLDASTPNS